MGISKKFLNTAFNSTNQGIMRHLFIQFAFCAAFLVSGRAEPKLNVIYGHSDGEMTLPVTLLVTDAKTNEPIPGARVLYLNHVESLILEVIEMDKQKQRPSRHTAPTGKITVTTINGDAKLECTFDAAFLWMSHEGGSPHDTGTDVFPSGRFIISKAGYVTIEQPARDLFKDDKYTPKSFETPTRVRLTKTPAPQAATK